MRDLSDYISVLLRITENRHTYLYAVIHQFTRENDSEMNGMSTRHEQIESPRATEFTGSDLQSLFPGQRALSSRMVKPVPSLVYHYTSRASGLAILGSSSIWASHIRFMPRDPDEYVTGLAFVERRIIEMMATETDPYLYDLIGRWGVQWPRIRGHGRLVACFSGSRDLPSQWEEYSHGGYSLVFDAASLGRIAGAVGYVLIDCIYDEHEVICAALIADALDIYHRCRAKGFDHDDAAMCAKHLFEIPISTVMPRLKKEKFRPEAEYRLHSLLPLEVRPAPQLCHRIVDGVQVPYEPVSFRAENGESALREIMVAPGVDFDRAKVEARRVLDEHGYSGVEITRSTLPEANSGSFSCPDLS